MLKAYDALVSKKNNGLLSSMVSQIWVFSEKLDKPLAHGCTWLSKAVMGASSRKGRYTL